MPAPATPSGYLSGGGIVIDGASYDDTVTVAQAGGYYLVTHNRYPQYFAAGDVWAGQVTFRGKDGADRFECPAPLRVWADGGGGNDTLTGGSGNDTLIGGYGCDELRGNEGADRVYGRTGPADGGVLLGAPADSDTLWGGGGADTMFGQAGADTLYGGAGDDRIAGDGGGDRIYGEAGADWLVGCTDGNPYEAGGDDDTISGGSDNDVLWGGDGRDRLSGDGGSDLIHGEGGDDWLVGCTDGNAYEAGGADDTVYGGAGNDTLWGGDGADRLSGEGGADWMNGEGGNDLLFGGATADRDVLIGAGGADAFLCMNNEDAVVDRTGEDGRLNFGGDGNRFWSEAEVMKIAEGAAWLQARTGNCRLLRTSWAGDIAMLRVEYLEVESSGKPASAENDNQGGLSFSDIGVKQSTANVASTFVHEIGHNWDTESPFWGGWLGLSGWQERSAWEVWVSDSVPPGMKESKDQQWVHSASAAFADRSGAGDDYGRTNPMEDWSTCWQIYFWSKSADPTVNTAYYAGEYVRLAAKMAMIDAFFNWAAR